MKAFLENLNFISAQRSSQISKYCFLIRNAGQLTRLTWLIHTSLLPSSCQLDKNFTLIGDLAQVHMSRKIFLIFLHAGNGNGKWERSGMIRIRYKYLLFFTPYLQYLRSAVGSARDFKPGDEWYETRCRLKHFFCKTFSGFTQLHYSTLFYFGVVYFTIEFKRKKKKQALLLWSLWSNLSENRPLKNFNLFSFLEVFIGSNRS